MTTRILTEALDLTRATLDPEKFTVRQRVIQAGWSGNGRYYAEAVLREAAPLLDGVRTFADHPTRTEQRDRPERSIRHITGYLRDPEWRDGALWATRHVVGEARAWLWPLMTEVVAGRAPDLIGCSINAVGTGQPGDIDGQSGIVVEQIAAFNSVDDVVAASAGGGFLPLVAGGDDLTAQLLGALTYDEWRAAQPAYVERLKQEWKTIRQTEALKSAQADAESLRLALNEAQTDRDDLRAQVATLLAEIDQTRRDLLLNEALQSVPLPAPWRDDLRETLRGVAPDGWADVIAREIAKARAAGFAPRVAVVGAGQQVAEATHERQANPFAPLPDEDAQTWWARTHRVNPTT